MTTMGTTEVVRELKNIAKAKQEAIKVIDRKRSWRPSEKAMTQAGLERSIAALNVAITWLEGKEKP